jgi:hypothetical protein
MSRINQESTSITKTYGNGTGYVDGLNQTLYNPTEAQYSGGNEQRGDTKKQVISQIYAQTADADPITTTVGSAPWSLANRYALFTYNGFYGNSVQILTDQYKDIPNNPLSGGDYAKVPSIARIIDFFRDLPVKYEYSDFMWTKYGGYMPNNYMLTLRRFATPCEDNILSRVTKVATEEEVSAAESWNQDASKWLASNPGKTEKDYAKINPQPTQNGEPFGDIKPDLARAITWMGEDTGNNLNELLNFTYGYKYKSQTSETNTQEVGSDQSYTSSPFYERMASSGVGGMLKAGVDVLKGVSASSKYQRQNSQGFDPYETTYPNFVVGPVNVINEMQTRDVGLNFDQDIKLVFEYDLKSYGNINPKVAFLDIMANLLVLTFDNANFWGGANRFYGGSGYVAPRFGDQEKLRQGDFRGFLGSLVDDLGGGFKAAFFSESGEPTIESVFGGIKAIAGTFFGNFLGKMVNDQLGAPPAMMHLKGMITGEATGNWHLTIGNPLNPIAMIGNLILDSSNLTFNGPLSNDDFPSNMKLECTLKHARPRDKTDFESMFNAGKGRLYAAAYGEEDILNLVGNDVKVYGAFQEGPKTGGRSKYNAWERLPGEEKASNYSSSQAINDYKEATALASRFVTG